MNNATITKTLNKFELQDGEYSIGFRRLISLPAKVRKSFDLAGLLNGISINQIHQEQKDFLESLSNEEFRTWMAAQ